MAQNGPNDRLGQNDLIPNWILAFARPKWTILVHFGPFWPEEVHFGPFKSANRTLAIPEKVQHIKLRMTMFQDGHRAQQNPTTPHWQAREAAEAAAESEPPAPAPKAAAKASSKAEPPSIGSS